MLSTIDSASIEADRRQTLARVAALEDRMQAEIDLAIKAEEAAYRTLAEIIDSEPTVIEVYVPALHCKIRMQPLTVEDYIKGLKYREERNEEGCIKFFVHMIKSTWGKCDPTVTEERLRKMGLRTLVKFSIPFSSAVPL